MKIVISAVLVSLLNALCFCQTVGVELCTKVVQIPEARTFVVKYKLNTDLLFTQILLLFTWFT